MSHATVDDSRSSSSPTAVISLRVLDLKSVVLTVARTARKGSASAAALEAFLDRTPAQSNYIYERRFGLFGRSRVFADFCVPRPSRSTYRQHIAVEKLNPLCELGLSDEDWWLYNAMADDSRSSSPVVATIGLRTLELQRAMRAVERETRAQPGSARATALEAFLDRTPAQSNYIYERRFGLFGRSSVFAEFRAPSLSHSTYRQHIAVEKLNPLCELGLSEEDWQLYLDLRSGPRSDRNEECKD